MTKINNDNTPVTPAAFARAVAAFHADSDTRTAGMEMERFLLRADGTLPDAKEHDALYLSLRQKLGERVSVEPGAHMIEIKTGAHGDAAAITQELQQNLAVLRENAATQGLIVTPASDLPGFPAAGLTRNLISPADPETGQARRAQVIVEAFHRHGWHEISNWGCTSTAIHLTHSVTDADHLLRWLRVHAALMPLYFAVFENRERGPDGIHNGLRLRREMKTRGLVADYVFAAKDGGDFADRYAAFAAQNQIVTALDGEGGDMVLDRPRIFGELPEAQQTLGNFLHAASASWNVCRIKTIFNQAALGQGDLKLDKLLLEVRDMDVSDQAVPAIAGWFCALTASDATLNEAETRLEALGVPVVSDPARAAKLTTVALQAVETGPHYLQTAFGNSILREAVTRLVLPMLRVDADAGEALNLWEKAAKAQAPPFKAPRP